MTPVMQTKFSDESLGTRGNCMAACVASLLGIPIDGIPSWEDMGDDGSWGDSFMSFLESNGYEYEGMIAPRSGDWKSDVLSLSDGVDGYFIVGGKSPRLHTRGHAVIYKNGVMIHDPHPSGAGLLEIEEIYIIERNAQEA